MIKLLTQAGQEHSELHEFVVSGRTDCTRTAYCNLEQLMQALPKPLENIEYFVCRFHASAVDIGRCAGTTVRTYIYLK